MLKEVSTELVVSVVDTALMVDVQDVEASVVDDKASSVGIDKVMSVEVEP